MNEFPRAEFIGKAEGPNSAASKLDGFPLVTTTTTRTTGDNTYNIFRVLLIRSQADKNKETTFEIMPLALLLLRASVGTDLFSESRLGT